MIDATRLVNDTADVRRINTIVVGAGQAGLSAAYHLARRGVDFIVLEGRERVGDAWRERWDSLRLFTPARFDGLDGMRFPAPRNYFPTKDEMADYLQAYAQRFRLPVLTGTRVESLTRTGNGFVATAGARRFAADNVVVAMANFQKPWVPPFASRLDPQIRQIHSAHYRNPTQLRDGRVLVVGAGNSGAEIAADLIPLHDVVVSGRDTGQLPFRIDGTAARLGLFALMLRVVFHRILTVRTPLGRKVRPKVLHIGGPLIRVKPRDLARAGVERVPRTTGVRDGRPLLADGRALDVENVVWCTGFRPGFDWIDPALVQDDEPSHRSGVVEAIPGLYFVGLHFLHALSSVMIHGVGRDADRVAAEIVRRNATRPTTRPEASATRDSVPAPSPRSVPAPNPRSVPAPNPRSVSVRA